MKTLGILLVLLSAPLVSAVPPPLKAPAIRVDIIPDKGETQIVQIYSGEYYRVDYREKSDALVTQIWWSRDDWKNFTTFLAKNKLPTQGNLAVKISTPEGALVNRYIQDHVVTVAANRANPKAAEQFRIEQLKKKDQEK